ncbi:MAG: endonuclease/exonuclease/phosphatase family protein [Clostridia bacterium]|nr:endonuclease/exonuclease/phosphatase family protein [Clostridia bacterium]
MKTADDFLMAGEDASNRSEILIGYTNREETAEVMSEIGYYDYAIRVINNKIVVAAHTEEALMTAIDVFCNELLVTEQKDGAEVLLLKAERTVAQNAQTPFFTAANPAESYRIVYPQGSTVLEASANELATVLRKRYSLELSVVSDAGKASEFEILIGVTNREALKSYYTGAHSPDPYCAIIQAVGNTLIVTGNDERTTVLACERFINHYADNAVYTPQFNFSSAIGEQFVAYVDDAHRVLTEGADLRVMSYNVLSKELSSDKVDFVDRQDLVFSTILNYSPDVVGLQEVSATAWNLFEQNLGHIYSYAGQKTPNDAWSYTGLMWNAQTVRLIETESQIFEVGNKRIRLFVWGLFEHIETGARFIVSSTHWDVQYANRPAHAVEMAEMVNALIQKYDVPVITTGDFNATEGASYYTNYLTKTNQTDTMHSSPNVILGMASSDVIDHVTCTANMEPLFFQQVKNDITVEASDHYPVYTDFRFQ